MNYGLTETQKNKIIEHWGNGFYEKVLQNYELYSEKWKLSDFEFAESYALSIIFFCKSELYGDCILKIFDDDELVVEYNALREYNGDCYVKAYGYEPGDHTNGAMLIERVFPGKILRDEPSLEKRMAVFSELWNGLRHIEPKNPEIYSSYSDWVLNAADDIINKREDKELYVYALRAKEIYLEMTSVYDKRLLIHDDLHSRNIISCGEGKYKIVDPDGVIGDPIFETGMFIDGECSSGDLENVEVVLNYLEKSLNIPNKILRQCFYIPAVTYHWDIDRVRFAESILNKGK